MAGSHTSCELLHAHFGFFAWRVLAVAGWRLWYAALRGIVKNYRRVYHLSICGRTTVFFFSKRLLAPCGATRCARAARARTFPPPQRAHALHRGVPQLSRLSRGHSYHSWDISSLWDNSSDKKRKDRFSLACLTLSILLRNRPSSFTCASPLLLDKAGRCAYAGFALKACMYRLPRLQALPAYLRGTRHLHTHLAATVVTTAAALQFTPSFCRRDAWCGEQCALYARART